MINDLPEDAKIIYDANGWLIYYSKSDSSLFLNTSDYHPEPLQLTKENLLELVGIIDRAHLTVKLN